MALLSASPDTSASRTSQFVVDRQIWKWREDMLDFREQRIPLDYLGVLEKKCITGKKGNNSALEVTSSFSFEGDFLGLLKNANLLSFITSVTSFLCFIRRSSKNI